MLHLQNTGIYIYIKKTEDSSTLDKLAGLTFLPTEKQDASLQSDCRTMNSHHQSGWWVMMKKKIFI